MLWLKAAPTPDRKAARWRMVQTQRHKARIMEHG
jgi:hypothetical protein